MNQTIIFPKLSKKSWRDDVIPRLKNLEKSFIELDTGDWILKCKDIEYISQLAKKSGLTIISIESFNTETIISANALGFKTSLNHKDALNKRSNSSDYVSNEKKVSSIFFHQGTLRSGEVLETDKDLLVLGDINPGAVVSAGGNVMIWGRLRGIAHAGKYGNDESKITALELRPVQLRISNKIARGPEEKPEQGLAEEAVIENEIIVIKPAKNS